MCQKRSVWRHLQFSNECIAFEFEARLLIGCGMEWCKSVITHCHRRPTGTAHRPASFLKFFFSQIWRWNSSGCMWGIMFYVFLYPYLPKERHIFSRILAIWGFIIYFDTQLDTLKSNTNFIHWQINLLPQIENKWQKFKKLFTILSLVFFRPNGEL